jgi:uncharacterized membrane protein YccF (DUF307 family)
MSIPLPDIKILSEIMRANIGMNLAYCNPVKKSSIFVTLSILLLGISHIRSAFALGLMTILGNPVAAQSAGNITTPIVPQGTSMGNK